MAHRVAPARGDFSDWRQNEEARGNAWMWKQGWTRPSRNDTMVVDEIEIEGARSPMQGSPASRQALDRMQLGQQGARPQIRFDLRDSIHEVRLVGAPEGSGDEKPGGPLQPQATAVEHQQSTGHRGAGTSPWSSLVAAEGDEYHFCLSMFCWLSMTLNHTGTGDLIHALLY